MVTRPPSVLSLADSSSELACLYCIVEICITALQLFLMLLSCAAVTVISLMPIGRQQRSLRVAVSHPDARSFEKFSGFELGGESRCKTKVTYNENL